MTRPPCSVCGRPYHRYSTSDPEHDWDGVACVNGLLHEIKEYREALTQIVALDKTASSWDDLEEAIPIARAALDRLEVPE